MALAITSFPVPVSPWIRTAESTGAILAKSVSTARNLGLDPIKSKVAIALVLSDGKCVSGFPLNETGCRLLKWLDTLSRAGADSLGTPDRVKPVSRAIAKRLNGARRVRSARFNAQFAHLVDQGSAR